MARELHDSVLHELANLHTNLDEASLSPKFQASYQEVTDRLREIVSDLRPTMLMYGILPAINEYADNLMERANDKIKIKVDVQAGEERLPENIEQHLFRIIQEACKNALQHANAKNITLLGMLGSKKIDLSIENDGKGFDAQPDLSYLIAKNHFGLANMIERANLIGAELTIQSKPETGTKIHITWKNNLI